MPQRSLILRIAILPALLCWRMTAGCSEPTADDCGSASECDQDEQGVEPSERTSPVDAGKQNRRDASTTSRDGGTQRADSGAARGEPRADASSSDGAGGASRDASSQAARDAGASPGETADLDCYTFLAHDAADERAPYKVGAAIDKYFQFIFAAPWQGTVYGRRFRFIIDNEKVTHHYLVFRDLVPGTPGVQPTVGAHPTGELLHGWAPGPEGEGDLDLREVGADVGFELPETTYTLEMHYNSNDPDAMDASGVEICVSKERPENIAAVHWLGVDQFLAPSDHWVGTCTPSSQQTAHIVQVTPHMHLQGVHMKSTINRADGTTEVLHDEPFDFGYQKGYPKRPSVAIQAGDTITTECSFSQPMLFGPSTNDEMCYLFTIAYPKGVLADGLPAGVIAHGDNACLGL